MIDSVGKPLILIGLVGLLFPNFRSPSQPAESFRVFPAAFSQSTANSTSTHDPTNGWMNGATATAWRKFISDGRYRWGTEIDFRFPAWAIQRNRLDLERAAKTPIQAGHIKGSYDSTEVALIVVDTTREDSNRYGVVIFSGSKDQERGCEIKWLLKDQDLSRVMLGWSSGETLGLTEYRDDGSYWHCFVKWNPETNAYKCDLKKAR